MSPGGDFRRTQGSYPKRGRGARVPSFAGAAALALLVVAALGSSACTSVFDEADAHADMEFGSTGGDSTPTTTTGDGTTDDETTTPATSTSTSSSSTTAPPVEDEPPSIIDLRVGGSVEPGVFSTPGLLHVVAEVEDDDEEPPVVVFYESRDGGEWEEAATISEPPYAYTIEITGADYSNGERSVRAVAREQLAGPDADEAGPIDFEIAVPAGGTQWWSTSRGTALGDSEALDVAFDGAGNLYVTGYTSQVEGGRAVWVARYLASGQLQWETEVQRADKDLSVGRGVAVDSQGNVLVVGSIQQLDGQIDYGAPELYAARYDPAGALAWETSPGKFDLRAGYAVEIDDSDNLVLTGYRYVNGLDEDVLLMGINGDSGSQRFSFSFGGERRDVGNDIALTADGDAVIAGTLRTVDDYTRAFVRKHDLQSDSKDTLWEWESDANSESHQDEALSIAVLPSQVMVVAGSKRALPSGTPRRIAFDLLPSGDFSGELDLELWNQYGPEAMRGVGVNHQGRLALTGVVSRPQGSREAWTQYRLSPELYAWTEPESDPVGALEISTEANAVAVGPFGTVAIAGYVTDEELPDRRIIMLRSYYP